MSYEIKERAAIRIIDGGQDEETAYREAKREIEERQVFYPCYCPDCVRYFYAKPDETVNKCNMCGSERVNVGVKK